MKYIVLIVFPDGERFWSHWFAKNLAEETLAMYVKNGAIGTIIATDDVENLIPYF